MWLPTAYSNNKFSPFHLNSRTDPTVGVKAWYDSSFPDVGLETGTESDIRRVQTVPNRAQSATGKPGVGGSLTQGTIANRPVNTSFEEGRAAFYNGTNNLLAHDGAAADFDFLRNTAFTVALSVNRENTSSSGVFVATCDNSGAAGTNGRILYTTTAGSVTLESRDNGGVEVVSWVSVLTLSQTHRVVFIWDGVGTAELFVDGVSQGTRSVSPIVASPTSNVLTIGNRPGNNQLQFRGWLPELMVMNRRLNDLEVQAVDQYLQDRWSMSVTYDDFANSSRIVSLFEVEAFLRSSGSAWVERLGTHSVTEVGTPTHGASANFGGDNAMTLDGIGQYAHFDSIASQFSGNDTPFSVVTAVELADTNDEALFSLGGPTDGRHLIRSTADWNIVRNDGASSSQLVSAGTPTTSATIVGQAFRQSAGSGVVSVYEDDPEVEEAALELPSVTFDRASTGVYRYGSSVEKHANGVFAAQIIGRRFWNFGDYMVIRRAFEAQFGL